MSKTCPDRDLKTNLSLCLVLVYVVVVTLVLNRVAGLPPGHVIHIHVGQAVPQLVHVSDLDEVDLFRIYSHV